MSSSVRPVPVALAFVLVLAGLVVLPQPSEAQVDGTACQKPAGGTTLTFTPNGSEVNAKQTSTQRVIIVRNQDTTQAVTEVTFTYEVPSSTKDRVVFVYGSKPGWEVRWQNSIDDPTNPNDGNTMTFRSTDPEKFLLSPGEEEPFTLYISLVGVSSKVLPLRVAGTFANGDPGLNAYNYCLFVDANAPTILWAMAFDRTGLPPFANSANGRLDQIEIGFSEPIDVASFRVQDFKIFPPGRESDPYRILNYEFLADQITTDFRPRFVEEEEQAPVTEPPIDLNTVVGQCEAKLDDSNNVVIEPRCTRLRFYLQEKSGYDTGIMPSFRYTPGTLKDMAGNLARGMRPEILDLARPVIVGALAYHNGYSIEAQGDQTYEEIVVTFSEDVVSNRGTNQPTCAEGNIKVGDILYVDGGNPGQTIQAGFNNRNNVLGDVIHPYAPGQYQTAPEQDPCSSDASIGRFNQMLFRTNRPSVVSANDNNPLRDPSVPDDQVKYAYGDVPRDPSYVWTETDATQCNPAPTPPATTCAKPFGDMICYPGGFDDRLRSASSIQSPDGEDDDPAQHEIEYKVRERNGRFKLQLIGLDNTNGQHIFPACRRVHLPDTIMAMVNIDSNVAIVQFTGPISDRTGDRSPLRPEDIDIVPTTVDEGCPQGQLAVSHTPGSDLAFVTMDDVACPTDVDDTPSSIRVTPGRLRATGGVYRINGAMAAQPGFPPVGEDGTGFVPTRDVPMVDLQGPRIIKAHTIDQDGNGAIDGMFVEFDERVDDASFCAGNLEGCRGPLFGGMLQMLMRPEEIHPDICVDVLPGVPQPDSLTCVDLGTRSGLEQVSCYIGNGEDASQGEAFYWETDLFANDRYGIIKWRVANPYKGGAPCVNPSPEYHPEIVRARVARGLAQQRDADPSLGSRALDLPLLAHQTGVIPDLMTTPIVGENLFRDQSVHHVLPASNPLGLRNRNPMKPIASHDIHEQDGAPAAILKAETRDLMRTANQVPSCRLTLPDNPTPPVCRDNGNGYLDTYRLTLSERISDASFQPANWTIGERRATRLTTGNVETDVANDHIVHVEFAEGNKPDTGSLPQLIHRRTRDAVPTDAGPTVPRPVTVRDQRTSDPGFRDLHNVPMNNVGANDVIEVDSARPVIVAVQGKAGESTLKVSFSEPVDDGSAGPLVRADLTYVNRFTPKALPGGTLPPSVSGFSGNVELVHKAGERDVIITLNGPLHEEDLKQDAISARYDPANGPYDPRCPYTQDQASQFPSEPVCVPQCPQMAYQDGTNADGTPKYVCVSARYLGPTGYVFESQPAIGKAERQSALNYPIVLNVAPDEIAPGAIADLYLDRVTSNSVRLTWTAPGDDGRVGTVTNYTIKVSTTPILKDDGTDSFDAVTNPEDLILETTTDPATKALLPAGSSQSVAISGLRPRTTYYFAVKAVDERGNTATISNQQSAETLQDTTPPVGTLTITSPTHKVNVASLVEDARFEWNEIKDPEGTVAYHYRLTDKPDYSVVLGDSKTTLQTAQVEIPAHGTWYFHVRAFSGAGPQPTTAHFGPIVIGATVVPLTAIDAANQELIARSFANETASGVEIEWAIPEQQLPGELEAIEIWRLEDGAWVRIHREPGTLATLRLGNFTDHQGTKDDKYLVTYSFQEGQRNASPRPSAYPGIEVNAMQDRTVPGWVFILLGVCLALILAGMIIFFVLRRRSRQELEQSAIPYAWENAAGPQTGIDQATGLPTHDVTCPNCSTMFQAVGEFPLAVTCPSCGASGTLD